MKIVWAHRPSDFGKPEYGVRRAQAIEKHLSIICEPQELRRLFDLWLDPSDELGLYLGGRRTEHIQVARQLIEILPSASIVEMLRYLVEDYWGRRSGWPDLVISRENEFFFAGQVCDRQAGNEPATLASRQPGTIALSFQID